MKNKHLVLLAIFGLLGLWFFQKWPFERKNQFKSSFLEYPSTQIKALSFTPKDAKSAFELRYTSEWVLTKGARSYTAVDSVVQHLLGSLSLLNHGQFVQLQDSAAAHAVLVLENAAQQRIERSIFKTADNKYVVRLLDGNPASYLLYDDYPLLDKLMKIEADGFRNPTILDFNPTDVQRLRYEPTLDSIVFFEKKIDADSMLRWTGPNADSLDIAGVLSAVQRLKKLPYAEAFDADTEGGLEAVTLTFFTNKSETTLTCFKKPNATYYISSSANTGESFLLPKAIAEVLFFSFFEKSR